MRSWQMERETISKVLLHTVGNFSKNVRILFEMLVSSEKMYASRKQNFVPYANKRIEIYLDIKIKMTEFQ